MGIESTIYDEGSLHMAAFGGPLPISYPYVPFDPPTGEDAVWLEFRFFPNETQEIGWGNGARRLYIGAFRISVYFRQQAGLFKPTENAEAVADHFAKGTELGPVSISQRPFLAPVVDAGNGAAFVQVTVPYRGVA